MGGPLLIKKSNRKLGLFVFLTYVTVHNYIVTWREIEVDPTLDRIPPVIISKLKCSWLITLKSIFSINCKISTHWQVSNAPGLETKPMWVFFFVFGCYSDVQRQSTPSYGCRNFFEHLFFIYAGYLFDTDMIANSPQCPAAEVSRWCAAHPNPAVAHCTRTDSDKHVHFSFYISYNLFFTPHFDMLFYLSSREECFLPRQIIKMRTVIY